MPNDPKKEATATRPVRPPSRQLSYQEVLHRMQSGNSKSNGAASPILPGRGLDISAIGDRIAGAVEFGMVTKAARDLTNDGNPQAQSPFAPIDLAALLTAFTATKAQGGDTSEPMMALFKYINETDRSSLQQEMAEIRHALSQPAGGNPTLETIQVLKELGMVGAKEERGNPSMETIQMLSTLGLIGNGTQKEPQSFTQQLEAFIAVMKMLAPPPAAVSPSQIQFPGGGNLSLTEYLAIEELRDKRAERREAIDLKHEQIKTTRELIEGLVDTVGQAAAAVRASSDGAAPSVVRHADEVPPARAPALPQDLACDFCSNITKVNVANAPEEFVCSHCQERNKIIYAND